MSVLILHLVELKQDSWNNILSYFIFLLIHMSKSHTAVLLKEVYYYVIFLTLCLSHRILHYLSSWGSVVRMVPESKRSLRQRWTSLYSTTTRQLICESTSWRASENVGQPYRTKTVLPQQELPPLTLPLFLSFSYNTEVRPTLESDVSSVMLPIQCDKMLCLIACNSPNTTSKATGNAPKLEISTPQFGVVFSATVFFLMYGVWRQINGAAYAVNYVKLNNGSIDCRSVNIQTQYLVKSLTLTPLIAVLRRY